MDEVTEDRAGKGADEMEVFFEDVKNSFDVGATIQKLDLPWRRDFPSLRMVWWSDVPPKGAETYVEGKVPTVCCLFGLQTRWLAVYGFMARRCRSCGIYNNYLDFTHPRTRIASAILPTPIMKAAWR